MQQLVSTNYTLSNVIGKLGLRKVPDLPISDMVRWMSEAIAHIGSYQNFEEKKLIVPIENYTGRLPLDCESIKRVTGYPVFKSIRGGFQIALESGEVEIIYDKFPTDNDGFPMINGDVSTQEAIVWYVGKWLSIQDILPNARLTPEYCDQKWIWYCGQARAKGYVPTPDQMERMVNVLYQLVPTRQYEVNFEGINHPEDIHLDHMNNGYY